MRHRGTYVISLLVLLMPACNALPIAGQYVSAEADSGEAQGWDEDFTQASLPGPLF